VPVIRRSKAVYDDKGQLIGAIEAFVDVSLIKRARSEIRNLKREIAQSGRFGELVGSSQEMRKLYDMIMMVAGTNTNIVIEGETGTGKELVARAIHAESSRSDNIFLAINCGAVPESLLEAELFGHKKGAFTGAVFDRAGCFETASGGTLFLDEIAEMPLASQVKLLRVLQENKITRVGENLPLSVNVRIIAATNKNLSHQVKIGQFREDLYYRLNVVNLVVPPLRKRRDDIADLVSHFIRQFNTKYKKEIQGCSPQVLDFLMDSDWPGNIRQLEHAIEHAFVVTVSDKKAITMQSLPVEIAEQKQTGVISASNEPDSMDEKTRVSNALAQANDNKTEAARILGITRAGLYKKIRRLEL
jgi:transcriptional regulator with PAS, ATPase and Fis domain